MGKIFLAIWVIFFQNRAMDLLQRTYELLDQTKLSQRQIAAGAGVKRDWLAKFMQKAIASPGAPKVQAVHNFLLSVKSGKQRSRAA